MTIAEAFAQALQCHRTGKLQQAEQLYRAIVQADPAHAEALQLLGMIAYQTGHADEAIGHLRESLRHKPNSAEVHTNLGNILADQRRFDEALGSYQTAIGIKPTYDSAHYNLGCTYTELKRPADAARSFREVIRLDRRFAEAHNNLGNALRDLGNVADAADGYREAIRLKPDFAAAHYNLGNALKDLHKPDEARVCYQEAIRLQPNYVHAYANLGNVLADLDRGDEAIRAYQEAIRLKPDYAEAHCNLGTALATQGRLDEAAASYRQALTFKPDYAEAHNKLGNALREQGKLAEAIATFEHALRLKPDYAEACNNLGIALKDQGKVDEAIATFTRALRLNPDCAETCINLGNALKDQCKLDAAIAEYRKAHALKPDSASMHSNLVFALHYHPGQDAAALCREARRWSELHARPLSTSHRRHANVADPGRRLRVGYVSPDFRTHPVSQFMLPLLANHDRRQVEIFCYADVVQPDEMTERLRNQADAWRATVGLSDEQLAGQVRADGIDILVDLALHSAGNRLLVFARKPAPVQATWLGYPGTTGLTAIDYRLTDLYFDPPVCTHLAPRDEKHLAERDEYTRYAEASIRLPDTYWCYDPAGDEPMVPTPPAVQNGFVTLGCLNNFCKINDDLLTLWAQIFRALPNGHLWLHAPQGSVREHVALIMHREGVAGARVHFIDRQSRSEYLQAYNKIDLCLDPWPCNGGVTSLDALWMGVPIVTLVGETAVGRSGWSLLNNLGLPELAARTPQEYVALSLRLANDLPRLQELRAGLRQRMRASPLMDGQRFARNVEQAYRHMWQAWCRDREP